MEIDNNKLYYLVKLMKEIRRGITTNFDDDIIKRFKLKCQSEILDLLLRKDLDTIISIISENDNKKRLAQVLGSVENEKDRDSDL